MLKIHEATITLNNKNLLITFGGNQFVILKACKYKARVKGLTCLAVQTVCQGNQTVFKEKFLFIEIFQLINERAPELEFAILKPLMR